MGEILNTVEAAKFLGIEPRTLEAWRYRDGGPRYIRYNKSQVRYFLSDLKDYQSRKVVTPTDQGASAA